MHKITIYIALIFTLSFASCDQNDDLRSPEDKQLENIQNTKELLQFNLWGFNDLVIDVNTEMRAIPLMANVADKNGMVQPGRYTSYDIYGNDHRQQNYTYQFIGNQFYLDSVGTSDFMKYGDYAVLRSNEMSLNIDSTSLVRYQYAYSTNDGIFKMTSGQVGNAKINKATDIRITKAIITGKPDDISNAVVDKILGNENVQESIQALLFDVIHGKVDEIAQNPEAIAGILADTIVQKLKAVEWETLVYDKLVQILDTLKVDNPEQAAQELAVKIANRIETGISPSDIYDNLLPILEDFENEKLPALVPVLSEAIYEAIANAFSEENIYEKIYPIWTAFSQVDSTSIALLSDSLGTVLTNHFFDVEDLSSSLEPFIVKLRNTSTVKIPALAQEIIDDVLIPLVDSLNASFPKLELDPDWESIKPVLSSALTVLKSSIDGKADTEAANEMAENLINIMNLVISQGVESALVKLQDIPADQAATVIAAWLNNLVVMAEPEIINFFTEKLNALVAMFNAQEIAEALSSKIYTKVMEVFSAENIYMVVLPIMERLSEINVEETAQLITEWLFDLGLIKDNVTEEQVVEALTAIISELIGNINVDEASQKLVDLILQSDFIDNIDGAILQQVLELKTYQLLIELDNDLSALEKVELSLIMK